MGFFCESWNRLSLFTRIMIGFAVGIILGLVMGPKAAIFAPLGTILTKLLTMVVAPLVFTLLVCAAADVGDGKRLGRIGIKTVIIFLLKYCRCYCAGACRFERDEYWIGVSLVGISTADQPKTVENVSFINTLLNIIPKNIFRSTSKNELTADHFLFSFSWVCSS